LDSGGENRTVITSSGGIRGKARIKAEKNHRYSKAFEVSISGAIGGHSGNDILKQRANVAQLLARMLFEYQEKSKSPMGIIDIQAGKSENAIPFAGGVTVGCENDLNSDLMDSVITRHLENYKITDPNIKVTYTQGNGSLGFDPGVSARFIRFGVLFFQGVQWMSPEIAGLPILSANLGYLKAVNDELIAGFSFRSPVSDLLDQNISDIRLLADLLGLAVEFNSRYPGYPFQADSKLRNLYQQWFKGETGQDLILDASHGGLELGIWKGAIPELDIITMGPIHELIHTFNEKLDLASFDHVYNRLCKFLGVLSDVD
jgi:dipeptidase D